MSFEITHFSCFCSGPIHTAENGGLFRLTFTSIFLHVIKTNTLKFTKYSKGVFV